MSGGQLLLGLLGLGVVIAGVAVSTRSRVGCGAPATPHATPRSPTAKVAPVEAPAMLAANSGSARAAAKPAAAAPAANSVEQRYAAG